MALLVSASPPAITVSTTPCSSDPALKRAVEGVLQRGADPPPTGARSRWAETTPPPASRLRPPRLHSLRASQRRREAASAPSPVTESDEAPRRAAPGVAESAMRMGDVRVLLGDPGQFRGWHAPAEDPQRTHHRSASWPGSRRWELGKPDLGGDAHVERSRFEPPQYERRTRSCVMRPSRTTVRASIRASSESSVAVRRWCPSSRRPPSCGVLRGGARGWPAPG